MHTLRRLGQFVAALALVGSLSLTAHAQIGSGWTSTTESFVIQTSAGCTATPNSSGGGTFTVPSGSGRAEFRFQDLSQSTNEQFQGDFTANSLGGDRVTCKQTFGPAPSTPWNIIDVTKANGGEFIEIEGGAVLAPYTIGTTARLNTIYNPTADTVDVYINGAHVEQKSGNAPPHYNKIGAYVSASGTGPATYTWQNVQFWIGGTSGGGGGTFTIAASAGSGGSISPSGNVTVSKGANQTFTITPNSGFKVSSVTVDGANVGAVTSYTFSNVQANHTISAAFASTGGTFTITASAGSNGSINPSGSVVVNQGANQTFMITPASGFVVASVTVDGSSVGAVTSYTFSNVQANHTISAAFGITNSSTNTFVSAGVSSQSGSFTATFDARPSVSPDNALAGLSKGAPTAFTSFACIVRFNTSGHIDARNGGSYTAASTIPFSAGSTYHFRLVVSVSSHTYSIFVTPPGGSEITVGSNYAFRTEQNTVTSLDHYGLEVDSNGGSGTLLVSSYSPQ